MLTAFFYLTGLILIGGIIYLIFAITIGKGNPLPESDYGYSHISLPAQSPITRSDVDNLAFNLVFRGYSQTQVDWVLDQLITEIESLNARIEKLTSDGTQPDAILSTSSALIDSVISHDITSQGTETPD